MPNIRIQDLTAIINGTSRYGAPYDTVHVETFIVTDEPIPSTMNWYTPNGSSVPKEVLALLKANNIDMYPQTEESILSGTQDVFEQAKANNLQDVSADVSRLLLRSVMKLAPLTQVPNTQNCYIISYDYKIYPNDDGSFEFKVVLPFDGLTMINGSSIVQTTVTCPATSNVDSVKSFGADVVNTQNIVTEETVITTNTQKPIVTFQYRQDPLFVINYRY